MNPLVLVILALAVGNGVQWWINSVETSRLEARNAQLTDMVENPSTGFVRQVAQCQTNTADLRGNLERLSGDVAKLAEDSRARDAALQKSMAAAQKGTGAVLAATGKLLAAPRTVQTIGTLEACAAGERALRGMLP